jgi:NAD(P)-dependent dehydrogenase (short-subunit alcohol dehydrogenase family)
VFDGKRVLIVGGSSGIGLETARRLARAGAHIMICGRDRAKQQAALDHIRSSAAHEYQLIAGHEADASDADAMRDLFGAMGGHWQGLDILVHVAGISGRRWGDGPVDECTEEGWDVVMRNNVRSVYLSNKLATQIMKAQEVGTIINVSSILGLVGAREHFVTHAYAASRGAVVSLTRAMAAYYSRFNIRVNCVCPGLLDTPMSQRAATDQAIRKALTVLQPLPPHIGYADDVAEAILYLAGDSAKFVTGVILPVDGGWSAS